MYRPRTLHFLTLVRWASVLEQLSNLKPFRRKDSKALGEHLAVMGGEWVWYLLRECLL